MSEFEVLLSEEQVQARVRELGEAISRDLAGEQVLVIGILKGAFIFMADLVRAMSVPLTVDFMSLSSYGSSTESSGEVRIVKDLEQAVDGKHVLVVEDIIDTGLTLKYLSEILRRRNPRSVRICALLDKPSRRKTEMAADYVGFVIPDHFVVGYGLDFDQQYRNFRDVRILKPSGDGGQEE